jgi:hypothetical protein
MKTKNRGVSAEARTIDLTSEPDFPPTLTLSGREGNSRISPERPSNGPTNRFQTAHKGRAARLLRRVGRDECRDLSLKHGQLTVGNEEGGLCEPRREISDSDEFDVRFLITPPLVSKGP